MYGQLPNVVGLTFGIVQITLYAIYRNSKPVNDEKLPEHKGDVTNITNNEIETVVPASDEKKIEVSVDIEIVDKKEEQKDEQDEEKKPKEQVTEVKNEKDNIDVNKSGCEV